MTFIINPGTEPVDDATEDNARTAVGLFIADLREAGRHVADWDGTLTDDRDGRWEAILLVDGTSHDVSMPGCEPAVTRAGRAFVSPRLYVDGSSWLWQYALSVLEPEDA